MLQSKAVVHKPPRWFPLGHLYPFIWVLWYSQIWAHACPADKDKILIPPTAAKRYLLDTAAFSTWFSYLLQRPRISLLRNAATAPCLVLVLAPLAFSLISHSHAPFQIRGHFAPFHLYFHTSSPRHIGRADSAKQCSRLQKTSFDYPSSLVSYLVLCQILSKHPSKRPNPQAINHRWGLQPLAHHDSARVNALLWPCSPLGVPWCAALLAFRYLTESCEVSQPAASHDKCAGGAERSNSKWGMITPAAPRWIRRKAKMAFCTDSQRNKLMERLLEW